MNKVFADLREQVISTIRAWGQETGTPEETLQAILALMAPSIRLVRKKGGTAQVGGLRAGGMPDLPEGTGWPCAGGGEGMSMSLVLQVPLAEVTGLDVNGVLPRDGLLSLFYYWDDDGGADEGKVLYFPRPLSNLKRMKAPEDLPEENRYKPYALEPRPEWTLPDNGGLGDVPEPDLEAWFALNDRVDAVQGLAKVRSAHRLLGNPDLIQSSSLDEGRILLLQAGPDYSDSSGMAWGDGGSLYCTLSEAELKAGQLDRAELMLEMG